MIARPALRLTPGLLPRLPAPLLARLLPCLMFGCPLPVMAQPSALEVRVERSESEAGHVYQVSAHGEVAAAPADVWRVLTDYERMPEFVPDLREARVLARNGDQVTVEQFGTARLLFLRRDIHLVVQVHEQPIAQIDISLVNGDMRLYSCRWRLVPVPGTGGTRLIYSGTLAPKFYVPSLLGASMVGADIKKMMAAVLERLNRAPQAG